MAKSKHSEHDILKAIDDKLSPVSEFITEQRKSNTEQKELNQMVTQSLYGPNKNKDRIGELECQAQQSIGKKYLIASLLAAVPIISVIVTIILHYWK